MLYNNTNNNTTQHLMDVNNLTGGILVERGIREKFVCEAVDVVKFKMCGCEEDLRSDEGTFSPEYAHQVHNI